eukprot:gene22047-1287_t
MGLPDRPPRKFSLSGAKETFCNSTKLRTSFIWIFLPTVRTTMWTFETRIPGKISPDQAVVVVVYVQEGGAFLNMHHHHQEEPRMTGAYEGSSSIIWVGEAIRDEVMHLGANDISSLTDLVELGCLIFGGLPNSPGEGAAEDHLEMGLKTFGLQLLSKRLQNLQVQTHT